MTLTAGSEDDDTGGQLKKETWATLVDAVMAGECTPFLGAGVAVPHLPTGAALSTRLAAQFEYPLADTKNLARVTQYIASRFQPAYVKRLICDHLLEEQETAAPALADGMPPNYRMLARLRLPIYITTNYDNYLERAVVATGEATPDVQICRWNDRLFAELGKYPVSEPAAGTPMIFHLHGHFSSRHSILVTEDDYIDFTVSLAQRPIKTAPVIPHFVRRALGNTNLLFIGYSLEDWNFRVLMRHLMKQQQVQPHDRYSNISIQLSDTTLPEARRRRAEQFLETYLKTSSSIDVHWGPADKFLEELTRQVDEAGMGRRSS